MTARTQLVDDFAADESATANDDDLHDVPSLSFGRYAPLDMSLGPARIVDDAPQRLCPKPATVGHGTDKIVGVARGSQ
jgi:hypothetical protein